MKTQKDLQELPDTELVTRCEKWIRDLCQSGGREWSLRVPPDYDRDPDLLFSELCRRVKEAQQRERDAFEAARAKHTVNFQQGPYGLNGIHNVLTYPSFSDYLNRK